MGIQFLDCFASACHIANYSIGAFILFSAEYTEASKNVCNMILGMKYSKIPNWVIRAFDDAKAIKMSVANLKEYLHQ